jgi:hypothetical protein
VVDVVVDVFETCVMSAVARGASAVARVPSTGTAVCNTPPPPPLLFFVVDEVVDVVEHPQGMSLRPSPSVGI